MMNSMLVSVQGQNQLVGDYNPAEEQEHKVNGYFPERAHNSSNYQVKIKYI